MSCANDFLGTDNISEFFGWYSTNILFDDELSEIEELEMMNEDKFRGKVLEYFKTKNYLQAVIESIKKNGWSGSTGNFPTKIDAISFYSENMKISEEVFQAIEWLKNVKEDSDYFYNLKSLILNKEMVSEDNIGYVASLIPTYKKTKSENQEKKKKEYIGKVSEKMETELTLKVERNIETPYGVSGMYIFEDKNENEVIYFTKKNMNINEGETKKFKFAVKKHQVYNNKQTVVTRMKEVK